MHSLISDCSFCNTKTSTNAAVTAECNGASRIFVEGDDFENPTRTEGVGLTGKIYAFVN